MEISKAIEQIEKIKRRYLLEPDMIVALRMAIRAFAAVSEASTYLDFVEKKPAYGENDTLAHYKISKMIKDDQNVIYYDTDSIKMIKEDTHDHIHNE